MATDYDAPRRNETDDMAEDSLDELKARRNEAQSAVVDVDESDTAEDFVLLAEEYRAGIGVKHWPADGQAYLRQLIALARQASGS